MRALVFDQTLSYRPHFPELQESDGDTLVKISRAGICSTDLEICRGYMGFSGILGHEFVGKVIKSPDKNLIGCRVASEINIVCGKCDLCLSGLSNHCRNRSVLGILKHHGAFAEYVRMPAANLHLIPPSVDDDRAVFIEPVAAACQILKQIKLDSSKWVTVIGDGRLGLLVAQVLALTGAPVRVIGHYPEKLTLCEKWSIKSRLESEIDPRHDQDVVVDCTGSPSGLQLAMAMVRPRGTIVLKSTFAVGKPINLAPIVIDEIQLIGSRCGPFKEAIRLLSENAIDVTSLIHRRLKLEQGVEAMKLAGEKGVLKVILTMDD